MILNRFNMISYQKVYAKNQTEIKKQILKL